jgi:DNA-binding transcriptional regulator YiaG
MPKRATAKKPGETLPDLLKKWREAKGLTKADAARTLGIPYRTLQDWELGNRTPRGFALRAIIGRLKR